MDDYLKRLTANQIADLIKDRIDRYLGREFSYTVKDLTTPNINTSGEKISFKVEIRDNIKPKGR